MKAVIQRVSGASVTSGGEVVGEIGAGLAVLLGVAVGDTREQAEKLASKIARLRIFESEMDNNNENGKKKLASSVIDIGGGVLIVSNFTLCGNCRKGNRPDFTASAGAAEARELYLYFIDQMVQAGVEHCATGRFGTDMQLSLTCDGPVTIVMDTDTL